MNINHLTLSWTTSRGADTYGYNIARLDDRNTGKRYKTCGGGYDMTGTVFGTWLADVYQDRLVALCTRDSSKLVDCGYAVKGYMRHPDLCGMTFKDGKVTLDGARGISLMMAIATAIGLETQWEGNRKGRTLGWFVMDAPATVSP